MKYKQLFSNKMIKMTFLHDPGEVRKPFKPNEMTDTFRDNICLF